MGCQYRFIWFNNFYILHISDFSASYCIRFLGQLWRFLFVHIPWYLLILLYTLQIHHFYCYLIRRYDKLRQFSKKTNFGNFVTEKSLIFKSHNHFRAVLEMNISKFQFVSLFLCFFLSKCVTILALCHDFHFTTERGLKYFRPLSNFILRSGTCGTLSRISHFMPSFARSSTLILLPCSLFPLILVQYFANYRVSCKVFLNTFLQYHCRRFDLYNSLELYHIS